MYLEHLRNWDVRFSWGSEALAYLYRQLYQASMRTKDSSSLCGQFGIRQGIPTELTSHVITNLHRNVESERERFIENKEIPHNDSAYQEYLVWYAERYRLKLKPGCTREEWSELVSEDPSAAEGYHAFNMVVRETGGSQVDYAPMHDEMKFRSRFHKWAAMLSCHDAQSVDVFTGGTSRSSRARRRQMTIDDIEEEEEEETAHDHEVDIDAPQPSQPP
ncbi:hypothetical protein D1007_07457 [Hordeum vulgare]|nr:hypothetical protein D1007_07457 [Hordeum vulgare]